MDNSNITVRVGDLFTSKAQTLVNTVNCVGVMGKGIALEFKKRFPVMFKDYAARCEAGEVRLGQPYLYKQNSGPWILNFPTKDHWREVSRITDIIAGFDYLEAHYQTWCIQSLAVPPLGCGNGQLDWDVVGPTLHGRLSRLDIPVEMYAPRGTPPEQLELSFLSGARRARHNDKEPTIIKIEPAAVALVSVVSRITREPYHWPVGRTMFQKKAYFLTESGIPTGLEFQRGSYGPFASDLKPLTARLINNGLITETKRGGMFVVTPGPTYPDARERYKQQLREWAPEIEKVADLFLRLRRTVDAEIAATVHFAAKELAARANSNGAPSELDVFEEVKRWKKRRKPPLDDDQIATTIRYLNILSWMNLPASPDLPVPEEEALA